MFVQITSTIAIIYRMANDVLYEEMHSFSKNTLNAMAIVLEKDSIHFQINPLNR